MLITKLLTEYQEHPRGLDEKQPSFSWELSSIRNNVIQSAYWLQIWEEKTGNEVWNTGKTVSAKAANIVYEGMELEPCTTYKIRLQVWDQEGVKAEKESWFETGLMNPQQEAWEGAQWIAAPRYSVMTRTRGVFRIESTFRMLEGADRAGIVFGEGDYRLEDKTLNEYGISGENYIRYEINLQEENHPMLHIYRVGYAPEDSDKKLFGSVELKGQENGEILLTPENRDAFHTLSVLVSGNQARASFDGVLVDAPTGMGELSGRVLNPRGCNDVLTYPRLNRIGFFVGEKGKVCFQNLTVSNVRTPGEVFIDERPEGGFVLSAEGRDGGIQVTKDHSNTSIPMLRTTWNVKQEIERARLYITSRGIYDVSVNGTNITGNILAPGLTQYDKRLQYQTYDVTKLLRTGKNGIGVVLSSGWWSDAQTFIVANYNYFGDKEALLCKLVLEYKDGTGEVVVSNPETWQYYGDGPWQYAGFFMGEQYDAGKYEIYRDFSLPEFDASEWERPVIYQPVSFTYSAYSFFSFSFISKSPSKIY